MNSLNKISMLAQKADKIWIKNWFEWFNDTVNGGFYERLDENYEPCSMPKRLLSQCRQIITYAQYLRHNQISDGPIYNKVCETFEFIQKHYTTCHKGGYIFSIDQNGKPVDVKYDLYAHAFVILMCAEYYKATKEDKAYQAAQKTLAFISEHFRADIGFHEALDENLSPIPLTRRQNPHMHLMEACTFAYVAFDDQAFLDVSEEILDLFFDRFLDTKTNTFSEFFDDDLGYCTQNGHKIEAGHHAEWIWLFEKYQSVRGQKSKRIETMMPKLFDWVITHGIDKTHGGVYNVQTPSGDIIDSDKRIWCQFETLRACAVMSRHDEYRQKANKLADQLINTIEQKYIDVSTGTWDEILNQKLNSISDYLPATTPYHIYPALKDCKKL